MVSLLNIDSEMLSPAMLGIFYKDTLGILDECLTGKSMAM